MSQTPFPVLAKPNVGKPVVMIPGRDSQNWSKRVIADSMFYTRLERTELSNAKLYIKTMILHHNHKMR